jgi:hypothetical protein
MRSRIGVWCDQVIEAGWLLAVIVAPLFFDVFSSRVFEPTRSHRPHHRHGHGVGLVFIRALEGLGRPAATDPEPRPAARRGVWARLRANAAGLAYSGPGGRLSPGHGCSITPSPAWGSYQRCWLYSTSPTSSSWVGAHDAAAAGQLRRLLYSHHPGQPAHSPLRLVQHYGLDPLPGAATSPNACLQSGQPDLCGRLPLMVMSRHPGPAAHATPARPLRRCRRAAASGPALLLAAIWLVQAATWPWWGWAGIAFVPGYGGIAAWVGLHLGHRLAPWVNLGGLCMGVDRATACVVFARAAAPVLGLLAGLACLVWILLPGAPPAPRRPRHRHRRRRRAWPCWWCSRVPRPWSGLRSLP